MNKSRRIGAVVATATAAVGMASVAMTAPAAAAQRGPEPVASWLRAVKAHSDSWIKIYWRTDQRICDASVTYNGKNVEINYWGNQASADFSSGASLFPGHPDYNTIEVNPDFDKDGIAQLKAVISYNSCRWQAPTQSRTVWLALPVQHENNVPGHGLPGGPGHGGPGNTGAGHGGPGNTGAGHGGPGNTGPGHGGPGNTGHHHPTTPPTMPPTTAPTHGGPSNGGPGNTGHHHPTTPATTPPMMAPMTAPTTAPATAPTTAAATPTTAPATSAGHSHGGQGQGQGQGSKVKVPADQAKH